MKNSTLSRLAASVGALSIVAYACGNSSKGERAELAGGSASTVASGATGGSSSLAGANAGYGQSGSAGALGTGGSPVIDTGGVTETGGSAGMPPVTEDTACGTGMASASLKPVNMFVVFDRSYSMLECGSGEGSGMIGGGTGCETGPTRWELAAAALTQFFQDPGAAGLGVALRFYPHELPVAGCTSDLVGNPALDGGMGCDVNACAMPLVDMGVLTSDAAPADAQEAALVNAVMTSMPVVSGEGTPTYIALAGAARWARIYQQANPKQSTVIVLVTDGEPNGCNIDTDAIAAIAADAFMTAQIRTYAIGLASVGETFVNAIAVAGGTDQAFFVSDGATATADLLAALNAIRGMALACDFPVPTSTSTGAEIDPNLINVSFTTTAGGEVELGIVPSAADCGIEQAWYYDDPARPTRIILCPAACSAVTDDINASITILAGCVPRIPIAR